MWAAKLPGEGALLYDACTAMCEVMRELGVAVDGGKDSLSMTARVNDGVVKAPGHCVHCFCFIWIGFVVLNILFIHVNVLVQW